MVLLDFADLLPFVFIGFAVDYYAGNETEGTLVQCEIYLITQFSH